MVRTVSVVPPLGARRVKTASNMDGFYDQQVPFVYPESVSFKCCTTKFLLHVLVDAFCKHLLLKFQKRHIEEGVKCLSERKRKFMDTELAQDTEGEFIQGHRDRKRVE